MPSELRRSEMMVDGRRVVVLSYPSQDNAPGAGAAPSLTAAEHEVLELLLAGRRNHEIAAIRGTSLGTVSKQVDSVYRKHAVHSRAELAARYGATS